MMIRFLRFAMAASALASLGGCISTNGVPHLDPYKGVGYGYYTAGNEQLTKKVIAYQDTVVQPRCEAWAKETTPNGWRMAGAYGVNHGVAGFAGGALGYLGETNIIGAAVKAHTVLGVGAYSGVASAFSGAMSGMESSDAQRHTGTRGCLASDAGGIHYIPPSIAKQVRNGPQSENEGPSFGRPGQSGYRSSAAAAAAAPQ
jgi:hypothetical protein